MGLTVMRWLSVTPRIVSGVKIVGSFSVESGVPTGGSCRGVTYGTPSAWGTSLGCLAAR